MRKNGNKNLFLGFYHSFSVWIIKKVAKVSDDNLKKSWSDELKKVTYATGEETEAIK